MASNSAYDFCIVEHYEVSVWRSDSTAASIFTFDQATNTITLDDPTTIDTGTYTVRVIPAYLESATGGYVTYT